MAWGGPWQNQDAEHLELRGKLGEGGMGAVYRAFDQHRGVEVALKTVLKSDAKSLYRFKREFRSLADVAHPNLVTLYELHTTGDDWFFTMELIDGVRFSQYVRPYEMAAAITTVTVDATLEETLESTAVSARDPHTRTTAEWKVAPSGRQRITQGTLDDARLVEALAQLADGVLALHRAGKLHRDLKPSNVLVESSGRVAIMDFGLTFDTSTADVEHTHEAGAVGTPMYMSPEQAADVPLTAASDWYSVGVMLYEALTGCRPFEGQRKDVLIKKQLEDPPPPSELCAQVPEVLDRLCIALLCRDPRQRPSGEQVLHALGREPSTETVELGSRGSEQPFVGRRAELAALHQAYAQSRDRSIGVMLSASSGMGKSMLVREFVSQLPAHERAIVLSGRCYQRESVPHKALDSLVDALTRELSDMPAEQVETMPPRDYDALATLFPVIKRVKALERPLLGATTPLDPQEIRRRAFGALLELLGKIVEFRPLVIHIDDLQWGDEDSAPFLVDLLGRDDAPKALLVLSYRTEDAEGSALVKTVNEACARDTTGRVHRITLAPFRTQEASELLHAIAPERASDEVHVGRLLADSNGSPMFLAELARRTADEPISPGATYSLDDLLRERVRAMGEAEQDLLRVCAVAGQPIAPSLAVHAAHQHGGGKAVEVLHKVRLLRYRQGAGTEPLIEPYHDRIRRVALDSLSADSRREIHRRLALAFELADSDDAPLVEHWIGAGERHQAGRAALLGAQRAAATLAFHRAASFYRLVLEHKTMDPAERRKVRGELGYALMYAGHLGDAAETFARAAEGADQREVVEFGRLELEQVLRLGHLDRGLELARILLPRVGLQLPSSDRAATVSILWNRFRLRTNSSYEEKSAAQVPQQSLWRLDVHWSIASSLVFVSPVIGRALQLQYMREAFRVGEPERVGMALSLELGYRSVESPSNRDSCERLRDQAIEIAERIEDRQLLGTIESATGIASFVFGHWHEAYERLTRGQELLRNNAANARWEIDITQVFQVAALVRMGRYRDASRLLLGYVREARERGDVYAILGLQGWRGNVTWLALDRPDEARRRVDAVRVDETAGFNLHHFHEMISRAQIELYEGRGEDAHTRVERAWPALQRSRLLRVYSTRMEAWDLRARCAIAHASAVPEARTAGLRLATRAAQKIESENAAWGAPLVAAIRSGIAALRGDEDRRLELLRQVVASATRANMQGHAAAAQYHLGGLAAEQEAVDSRSEAREWMAREQIGDPARFASLLVPAPSTGPSGS